MDKYTRFEAWLRENGARFEQVGEIIRKKKNGSIPCDCFFFREGDDDNDDKPLE